MAPKDVGVLIPGTCEHVPYTAKGLAGLRMVRWRDHAGFSQPNVITRDLIKKIGRQEK